MVHCRRRSSESLRLSQGLWRRYMSRRTVEGHAVYVTFDGKTGDLMEALGVSKFLVGHAQGVDGVLLLIDGDLPSETIYSVSIDDAIGIGKLLMAEGQKQRNIKGAVSGVATPRRKLTLPGDLH